MHKTGRVNPEPQRSAQSCRSTCLHFCTFRLHWGKSIHRIFGVRRDSCVRSRGSSSESSCKSKSLNARSPLWLNSVRSRCSWLQFFAPAAIPAGLPTRNKRNWSARGRRKPWFVQLKVRRHLHRRNPSAPAVAPWLTQDVPAERDLENRGGLDYVSH
jgi:hypothetical protein